MIRETLENGTVRITLDNLRWYEDPQTGHFVPSTTWILDHYPKGQGFYQWLANKVKSWEDSQDILTAAGDRGSNVHAALEDLMKGKSVTFEGGGFSLEEWRFILAGANFLERMRPTIIAIETPLIGEDYGCTADLVCMIDDGYTARDGRGSLVKDPKPTGKYSVWLLDWKTSGAIYPQYHLQVSAYKKAYDLNNPGVTVERCGIVRLGSRHRDGYEFVEVEDIERHYDVFRAVRRVWEHENPDAHPRFVDVPESLSLQEIFNQEDSDVA